MIINKKSIAISLSALILTACGGGDNKSNSDVQFSGQKEPAHKATKVNQNHIIGIFQDDEDVPNAVEVLLYDKNTTKGSVKYYISENGCLRDVEKEDYNYRLNNKPVKRTNEGYAIIDNKDLNIIRVVDSQGNFTKIHLKSPKLDLYIGRSILLNEGESFGDLEGKIFLTTMKSANYSKNTFNEQLCQY